MDPEFEQCDQRSANSPNKEVWDLVPPTCVLSLSSLPDDITELELANLAEEYGAVRNIILMRNGSKAFVEMADLSAAVSLYNSWDEKPLMLRSFAVSVAYSKHNELTLKMGQQTVAIDSTLTILHIVMENIQAEVTVDKINEEFTKFGFVQKILIFKHIGSIEALVEFENGLSARNAKRALNGQKLFPGCCKLFIEHSNLKNLVLKCDSEMSRDYTKADLPWNESPSLNAVQESSSGSAAASVIPPLVSMPHPDFVPMKDRHPVILVTNLKETKATPDRLFTLFGMYGKINGIQVLAESSSALVEFDDYRSAINARKCLVGMSLWGRTLALAPSDHLTFNPPFLGSENAHLTKDFTNTPVQRFINDADRNQAEVGPPSKTLFLYNIPPLVTERGLTEIFGMCGQVTGFRFLNATGQHDQKRSAIVEMSNLEEGIEALMVLHNTPVTGGRLSISFTKHLLDYSHLSRIK